MASFTPEQIEQFLEEFFNVVGRRQYIGARYVPIFGRKGEESIAWDNSAPYEPLTIVLYQGDSYTSRTYVPAGIDILNQDYWVLTGNYNAQIAAYREEVLQFDGRIASNTSAIAAEVLERQNADTTLTTAISNETLARQNADTALATAVANSFESAITFQNRKIIWIGDSFCDVTNDWGGWVAGLASLLGCSIYNYAHNGSGFVNKASTDVPFLQQLQTGLTEHPDATDIVVYGGNNDCGTLINNQASTYDAAVQDFFTYAKANAAGKNFHMFIGNVVAFRGDMGWTQRYYVQNAASLKGVPIKMYPYVNAVQIMSAGFYSNSNYHPSVNFANNELKWFFMNSLLNGAAVPTRIIDLTLGSGITSSEELRMYAAGDCITYHGGVFTGSKESGATLSTVDIFTIGLAHPIPRENVKPQYFNTVCIVNGITFDILGQLEFSDRRVRLYFQSDSATALADATSYSVFIPELYAHIEW